MQPVFFVIAHGSKRAATSENTAPSKAVSGGRGAQGAQGALRRAMHRRAGWIKKSGGAGVVRSAQFFIGQQPHLYLSA